MADWTDIDPNTLLPGEPWTSAKALASFENVSAMAEGAVGAPRILGYAIAGERFGGLPVATVTATNDYVVEYATGYVAGITTTSSTSDVVGATYTIFGYTGSMRFRASATSTGGGVSLKVFKNGVLVSSNIGNPASVTADIPIVPGDVIQWRFQAPPTFSSTFAIGTVTASNAYQAVIPLALAVI